MRFICGAPHYIAQAMEQPEQPFADSLTVGAAASVMLHAVVLLLLIFGLPQWRMEPEEPEAIQVQLVQPEEGPGGAEDEPEVAEEQPTPSSETQAAPNAEVEPVVKEIRRVSQYGKQTAGPKRSDIGEDTSGAELDNAQRSEVTQEEPETQETAVDILSALGGDAIVQTEIEETLLEPAEKAESVESLHDNEITVAATAMEETSRRERASVLCLSKLHIALRQEAWRPDYVPKASLKEGTVLEETNAAFKSYRADPAQWLNLQFRCEVNQDATKIVSFEYEVGDPIPREEWPARKFPAE